jgi:two-component system phosphate regulon sensor histidine kinase PhoR
LTSPKFSFKSVLTSAALALLAGVSACALWREGFLAPVQQAFLIVPTHGGDALIAPELRLGLLLILATALVTGLAIERAGARRAFPYLGSGFLAGAVFSLLASRFLGIDVLFIPMALSGVTAALVVQLQKLWSKDLELTRSVNAVATQASSCDDNDSKQRLMGGLKLLDTVLSLNEAIVFVRDEDRALVPAARLRASASGPLNTSRNSTWREGVDFSEQAIAAGEFIMRQIEGDDAHTLVAVPLKHEGRTVGALLIRLRETFGDIDRPLLSAVAAQIARNLQREEAGKARVKSGALNYVSARAAEQRLESVHVLSGLLTERRFGAQALSESSDGLAVAYLDGTIAHFNGSLLETAKLTESEARKLDLFGLLDCFRTDVFDEPVIAVRRVLQTGEAYEGELNFTERNQILGLRIALLRDPSNGQDEPGEPLCLSITVRDLTKLKQYEQLKSDMISLMSHELRTPLTSINGFAELLVADEAVPEHLHEFVTIISNEAQRMSRMINTFLAVTQLERKDKQEVLKIPLRLNDIVREIVAGMQPTARKKRIRLVEQPADRIPPVAADKGLILQAVKNLVHNAIKYSPERTTVTVSTALEAEAVRVCVEDRGYGVPSESIDRVWEKFYRVVREGQEKDEESTGLGLSFVREVIEQHGGRVDLESEPGRGSKFSFTLPRL